MLYSRRSNSGKSQYGETADSLVGIPQCSRQRLNGRIAKLRKSLFYIIGLPQYQV